MEARGWSDAKKGHEPRNAGELQKLRKEMDYFLELPERMQPC